MSDINSTTITGNIVRDPESVADGGIARFTVAVNYSRKLRDGEDAGTRRTNTGADGTVYVDDPSFIDCKAFNGNAKKLLAKAGKGNRVTILGRLVQEKWDTPEGNRSRMFVYVTNIEGECFFAKSATPAEQAELTPEPVAEEVGVLVTADAVTTKGDDDIPF